MPASQIDSNKPASGNGASARAYNSPELRRVLANIRVLVAIVAATETMSLSLSTRPTMMLAVLAYAAWAGTLCWIELQGSRSIRSPLTSWIDAAWLILLAGLAGTQSSIYTLLLLFPVLFAALSFGFLSGLAVSLFSASAIAVELMLRAPQLEKPNLEIILQPLSLLVLGPLVAGLARAGVQMSEQITVADRLLGQAEPRQGVKRVAETLLQGLAHHFSAELGLLQVSLPGSDTRLFRTGRNGHFVEVTGELRATLVEALGRLPPGIACVHHRSQLFGRFPLRYATSLDIVTKASTTAARAATEELAEMLDARSLLAIPVCRRRPRACCLVLESGDRRYRASDAELISAIMDQLAPVIENAGLLERLAEESMATERARIGRDLHDTAIQPYLGLKYGIEALARKAAADNPLRNDIHALREIAVDELHRLRELVSGMRDGSGGGDALLPALQRQAKRFREIFGMDVSVQCEGEIAMRRKLAASIFPMVNEALTNIRRHTAATHARILVRNHDDSYVVDIRNPHDVNAPPPQFVPRSIVERAESVSGCVVVDIRPEGFTDLIITIPKTA